MKINGGVYLSVQVMSRDPFLGITFLGRNCIPENVVTKIVLTRVTTQFSKKTFERFEMNSNS